MGNLPDDGRDLREHDRYKRLVAAAGIKPDQDLSPRGQVVLAWVAKDEVMTAGVVEIIAAAKKAVR